jgi:hypothetical protein
VSCVLTLWKQYLKQWKQAPYALPHAEQAIELLRTGTRICIC